MTIFNKQNLFIIVISLAIVAGLSFCASKKIQEVERKVTVESKPFVLPSSEVEKEDFDKIDCTKHENMNHSYCNENIIETYMEVLPGEFKYEKSITWFAWPTVDKDRLLWELNHPTL